MNSRIKIILLAVLLIVLVIGADRLLKIQQYNYIESEVSNSSGENTESSSIIKVTSENFSGEVLQSEKKVLIDFYATWCEPCKILSPIVEEIAKERDDIKVVKIDIDEEFEIADTYRIFSIPTLVVIENGVEIERVVGVVSKEEIENMLK